MIFDGLRQLGIRPGNNRNNSLVVAELEKRAEVRVNLWACLKELKA